MFSFTISDLSEFLGRSPVTIRNWERKGIVTLPRLGANRTLGVQDVRRAGMAVHSQGYITDERWALLNDALGDLHLLERANEERTMKRQRKARQ